MLAMPCLMFYLCASLTERNLQTIRSKKTCSTYQAKQTLYQVYSKRTPSPYDVFVNIWHIPIIENIRCA